MRRATLAALAVPTLCGAAYRNQGVHNLLDEVVDFLPAPRATDPDAPLAALVFKVMQHNNFDMICPKLRLRPGDKLIEVGPGWGYLSMLAAEKYGADVTCYGLVGTQNDGMRELMRVRGFSGKVTLVERDHRELADEPDRYDRFVSIGVHEHAGRDCNKSWIHSIARGLRPGGIGLISVTFNMRARPTNYCTIKHIFPGGFIPSLAQTLLLMEKHGLNLISIENRTYHYHCTVQQWLKNFETHWERIRAIDPARFSVSFRRSWLFYLGGR